MKQLSAAIKGIQKPSKGKQMKDCMSRKYKRIKKMDGGMLEDTYDNVEDPEAVEASQLTDQETEQEYFQYVVSDVLSEEEQAYLAEALDNDPELEMIIEKVIVSATEFTGEGNVEGPGTGVSDSVPARLSDGEFVITEKATEAIGPENLQGMMDSAEKLYDGGMVEQETKGLKNEIERMMLNSSKMPSSQ